jgi:GT2 family glycosyltransferase
VRPAASGIDVVVLTWNDADDARRAVQSALDSVEVDVQVIVVDNGSSVPFNPEEQDVLVVRSEVNLGVGGGRNLGAGHGQSPFLCFLDSDAVLEPDALRVMLEELTTRAEIGLVAPRFSGQPIEIGAGRAPSPWRKIARGLGLTDTYRSMRLSDEPAWDVEFGIGACQVVRRSAFESVGGLDASDRFGPEDVDFCLRLGDSGWRLRQVEAARCKHVARRGSRRLLSRRGAAHLAALVRHYARHRRFGRLSSPR